MLAKTLNTKALFFTVFFLLCAVTFYKGITIGVDVPIYHTAAQEFALKHFDAYSSSRNPGGGHYTAGPMAATLWVPFADWNTQSVRWLWAILNIFFFIGLWFFTEANLKKLFPHLNITYGARLLTLLMLLDPVSMNGIQGNWTCFLLLLCQIGFYFFFSQKPVAGGFISSLAFCIKPPYGFPLLYFMIFKSKKAVLAWSLGAAFFAFGIPLLVYGPEATYVIYQDWAKILSGSAADPYCKFNNQSSLCVGYHIFGRQSTIVPFFVLSMMALSGSFLAWASLKLRDLGLAFIAIIFVHLTWSNLVHDHYHIAMMAPMLLINTLLVQKSLNLLEKSLWVARFIIVHVFVLDIVGRESATMAGFLGQHLWGLILAMMILFSWSLRENHAMRGSLWPIKV